jgi:imidazolonepropionase-like amidohydrolase
MKLTMWRNQGLMRVVAVGACAMIGAGTRQVDSRPIALLHGILIDGRGGPPVVDATLLIRGGVIEAVSGVGSVTIPKDARVFDASGKTVMPGLADMHVHMVGGWDGNSVDLLGYQQYFNALLYAGVTTVLDTGNFQPWVLQVRREAADGRLLAPRIYCTGAFIDGIDAAWPDLSYELASMSQVPDLVSRDKQAGVDLIKAYANLSDTLLERLAAGAAKEGLRVIVDTWDRNGSPEIVGYGVAGFAHLPFRAMLPQDIQTIKGKGVFVITTLAGEESHARTRLADPALLREPLIADTAPPDVLEAVRAEAGRHLTQKQARDMEDWRVRLAAEKTNLKKLHDTGVLIAAGTDAPYPGVFQGEAIHRELELLVESGLTPLEAIRAATYDAARVMKAETEWGSLQPGRRADVLIVSGRPDEQISDTRKIDIVIQKGKVLDRRALRFDPTRDPSYRAVPLIRTFATED